MTFLINCMVPQYFKRLIFKVVIIKSEWDKGMNGRWPSKLEMDCTSERLCHLGYPMYFTLLGALWIVCFNLLLVYLLLCILTIFLCTASTPMNTWCIFVEFFRSFGSKEFTAIWRNITSLILLSFFASSDGIRMDPSKVEAIISWPILKSIPDIRSFHRLASFHCRFIKNFITIISSITYFMKGVFKWPEKAQKSLMFSKGRLLRPQF